MIRVPVRVRVCRRGVDGSRGRFDGRGRGPVRRRRPGEGGDHGAGDAQGDAGEFEAPVAGSDRDGFVAERERDEPREDRYAQLQGTRDDGGGEGEALEEEELVEEDAEEGEDGHGSPRDGPAGAVVERGVTGRAAARVGGLIRGAAARAAQRGEVEGEERRHRHDVAIRAKDVAIHPALQRQLADDVVAGVAQLDHDQRRDVPTANLPGARRGEEASSSRGRRLRGGHGGYRPR